METFFCSYCGNDKSVEEKTAEHVIPQKLGGAVSPVNPFKLDTVCKRCNATCGKFVDGPFVLNSLVNAHHALVARDFADIETKRSMPLNYMGYWDLENPILNGYDCEVWLGPTGDHVFHFHKPNPQVPGTLGMVSMKFLKDIDPGFVMAFLTSNNPEWHPTIINSVLDNFNKETLIYFANVGFQKEPTGTSIRLLDEEKKILAQKIKETLEVQSSNGMKIQQAVDIGFAERFQAKVALGFGSLFLKPDFQRSSYAKFLRDYLWTKTTDERKKISLHGKGILSGNSETLKLLGHRYCISAVILPVTNGIGLMMNFFSQFEFMVLISDDLSHWPENLDKEGIGITLVSPLKSCIGPLPLMEFVGEFLDENSSSKLKATISDAELKKKALPPYMI